MGIMENIRTKGLRFAAAYAVVSALYFVFEYIYMPWLTYQFGYWMFVPLYPSILLANFGGVYLYNWLGEDVLFMEYGRSWLDQDGGKLSGLKKFLRQSEKKIFIALSIWPSPIAGYLFFRKEEKCDSPWDIFRVLAEGSIYCTAVYGGLLALAWLAITSFLPGFPEYISRIIG